MPMLTCAFAWLKGAWPERLGSSWVLAMYLASDLAMAISFPDTPQLMLFSLDFLLALGLLALTVRFSSLWLGLAMLLQSLALLEHALILGGGGLSPIRWSVMNDVISLLMLMCIVAATIISWRGRGKKPPRPAFSYVGDASTP